MEYEVKTLEFSSNASELLEVFEGEKGLFLLESSLHDPERGRYSFLGFDPFAIYAANDKNALEKLRKEYSAYKFTSHNNKSSLGSGIVGFLGYDLGIDLENIPKKNKNDLNIPKCYFGFYDCVITIDHFTNKLHIHSSGLPEKVNSLRKKRARERIEYVTEKICNHKSGNIQKGTPNYYMDSKDLKEILESDFTKKEYIQTIQKALEHIAQGDIYQVNLSQRFHISKKRHYWECSPRALYQSLKEISPSCFGGYLDGDSFQVISSSPERFIQLKDNIIQSRPMKGTRPRGNSAAEDQKQRNELMHSQKDEAELLMITDLMRNDLGRVCQFGTIHVKEMRTLEEYNTVYQATSTIEGQLDNDKDQFDILKACFPGGSITGCPKIRSMEIIEELEPHHRSVYTGTLGYISFNGEMDFNIMIRTILNTSNDIFFHVGGGIVADSQPVEEYNETLVKARAMLSSLTKHFSTNYKSYIHS